MSGYLVMAIMGEIRHGATRPVLPRLCRRHHEPVAQPSKAAKTLLARRHVVVVVDRPPAFLKTLIYLKYILQSPTRNHNVPSWPYSSWGLGMFWLCSWAPRFDTALTGLALVGDVPALVLHGRTGVEAHALDLYQAHAAAADNAAQTSVHARLARSPSLAVDR